MIILVAVLSLVFSLLSLNEWLENKDSFEAAFGCFWLVLGTVLLSLAYFYPQIIHLP